MAMRREKRVTWTPRAGVAWRGGKPLAVPPGWRGTLRGCGEGAALSGEQGEGGLERGGVPPCQELPKSWRIRTKPQRAAGDFGQWKSDCRKLGVPESKAADLRACQWGRGLLLSLGRFLVFNGKNLNKLNC